MPEQDPPSASPTERKTHNKNVRRTGGPVARGNRNRNRRRGRRKGGGGQNGNRNNNNREENNELEKRARAELEGPETATSGMLELSGKGFGFLRRQEADFAQDPDDVFVPPEIVRAHGLRPGTWIDGLCRSSNRGPQLTEVKTLNGLPPEDARRLPHFDELKAVNPTKRLSFEHDPKQHTTRLVDLIAPVGRGQRGLIVSPPRSGKTTLLLHMAEAARELHEDTLHLIVLLVDERPEEVTEFKRQFPDAEIYASSNDQPARNHCRLAELCIERAKRLVEAGQDVFLLMDSITRLARAYNSAMQGGGKNGRQGKGRGYQSGGIVAGALEMPRRLFAAARATREAGTLTIIATALVQTNARADEAIFQEFKGTGNMELVLDRKIAEQYIFPAVDIFKSGTRREELILPELQLHKIHLIRRGLSGHKPSEAMERLLFFLGKSPGNAQMLLDIKG